jgi:hypothetical protein
MLCILFLVIKILSYIYIKSYVFLAWAKNFYQSLCTWLTCKSLHWHLAKCYCLDIYFHNIKRYQQMSHIFKSIITFPKYFTDKFSLHCLLHFNSFLWIFSHANLYICLKAQRILTDIQISMGSYLMSLYACSHKSNAVTITISNLCVTKWMLLLLILHEVQESWIIHPVSVFCCCLFVCLSCW